MYSFLTRSKTILTATLFFFPVGSVIAEENNSSYTGTSSVSEIALNGYSPVSYQSKNKAERGKPSIAYEYEEKTYYFSDEQQRHLFQTHPEKYTPAFDGYCAYGIAKDARFPSNPETFKVVGGRTFLFLNDGETNTFDLWNQENESRLTRAANINWEKQTGEAPVGHYNIDHEKLGLQGYCPVAYFAVGKAVKGDPEYSATYRGVTYHLVNKEVYEMFKKNPQKFEPAFGGWCATGMSIGEKFPIDPHNFKIVENRLMLFKKDENIDALKIWNEGKEAENIDKADKTWDDLING